jgi:DNA-binding YbaB/EbfC family protein
MVNFNQFLKQAQSMQSKMQEMQASMDSKEFEGKSGGGMVFIKITGRGELKSVSIDDSIINPDEKELLEDLIVAAYNDAKTKADSASQEAMSGALGGLNLPPGFKLPF